MKAHLSPPSDQLFLMDVKNQGRAGSAGEREHSTAEADWGCQIQVSPALNSWLPARQRSSTELGKEFSNTAREHRFFSPHTASPAACTALQTQACTAVPVPRCLLHSIFSWFVLGLILNTKNPVFIWSFAAVILRQPLTATSTLPTWMAF